MSAGEVRWRVEHNPAGGPMAGVWRYEAHVEWDYPDVDPGARWQQTKERVVLCGDFERLIRWRVRRAVKRGRRDVARRSASIAPREVVDSGVVEA